MAEWGYAPRSLHHPILHRSTMDPLPALDTPWPPGTRLRHYKGGLYEVAGYCLIEATLETGVLYRPLDAGGSPKADLLWMRPLARFSDPVETAAGTQPRFQRVAGGD